MNDIVGYRFHPTDVEIIDHYLRLKLQGDVHRVRAINEVNVFKHNPWDLCRLSAIQSDSMWHFFCCKNFKYASGERVNRTTDAGYWKKTGDDRKIKKGITKQVIGVKKNLVFHIGRSPNGKKTSWIMHEYHPTFVPPGERTFVLCRIEKKEGEEKDGTPGAEREPSSHAPSGSRDHVGDNTVSAPEVIGNNSLLALVTENGERVLDNTVFSPEVIRDASQQTLLTGNRNCVVEKDVSSPEGNYSIETCLRILATTPLEQLGIILSPASEFQGQETVAPSNIQAENCFANNLEGALFNSCGNMEGDYDIDLFLRHVDNVNHLDSILSKDNDDIIDHRRNPFGSESCFGHAEGMLEYQISSSPDIDQHRRGESVSTWEKTAQFQGIDQHRGGESVSTWEKEPQFLVRTVSSDAILEINALTISESSDGSQDSPKSLSDAAASSPAKEKSVPRELESSRDIDINVFPLVENFNDSQHSAISSFSAAASRAAKGSAHMQQKSYATSRFVAPSSPATKKRDKMGGKSSSSPATKKSVNMEQSSRSLFDATASPATKKRVSMVQKSSRGIKVLPMVKIADNSLLRELKGKKSVYMQQKSSPKSMSKDTKKGSTTASPARKSVYAQPSSSSETWSEDTTEESSSSSDDIMTSLARYFKGVKLA